MPTLVFIYTMICMSKGISLKHKLNFILKNGCFSNWSCKKSHVVETEWARLFLLYLIDFSVVILHPVFRLYLSVTEIRTHCTLVVGSCVVNGLKCAQILILVSKVYICDMCCMSFKNSSFTKHLLPSYCFQRIFLEFSQFSFTHFS